MTASATEVGSQYSLSNPPAGARFDYDEVKTDRGQKSLGSRPILTWDETDEGYEGAVAFYGKAGIARFINGTSARVSFQSIIRRGVAAGKTDEQLAEDQLKFRPGTRQAGTSTPASRAANAAKKAASKINGDAISELLSRIGSGTISPEQLRQLGIDVDLAPVEDDSEDENGETE